MEDLYKLFVRYINSIVIPASAIDTINIRLYNFKNTTFNTFSDFFFFLLFLQGTNVPISFLTLSFRWMTGKYND